MYSSKTSQEVAVEAAARVDTVLVRKSRMKPGNSNTTTVASNKNLSSKIPLEFFSTEFEINDVPISARNLLTKGVTQEEINHYSGALISTRGRYIHPEDKGKIFNERPLYLYIQGPNKQSLDLAIQRIDGLIKDAVEQEIMKIRSNQPPPSQPGPPLVSGIPQQGSLPFIISLPGVEKVLVGLDHAPPSFDVRNKVIGPGGTNLQYIYNETGALVTLKGRGSGFHEPNTGQESPEPLHICVEHSKPEILQQGRQLALNLVETIQQEFNSMFQSVAGPQIGPPHTIMLPPGYQPLNVAQSGVNVGSGIMTAGDQGIQQNPTSVGGTQGVITSPLTVPVFSQHTGQIVSVPPPTLSVPPPQLMHQPPPHVQIPPPGVHIPSQQGPLVPPPSQQAQQHQHHVLVQQHPPPHQQNHVATSQAAAVAAVQMQIQQQQQGLPPNQGQIQVNAQLSQPPPTFTHPHPQMMTSTAMHVINGIASQHQPQPSLPQQHQQQQAIITQTSYPIQYIQTNGQTIMAYPAGTIRPEQLAAAAAAAAQQPQIATQSHVTTQIPTAQLQPGCQQIVLQPATVSGQPQQVQLAQLMQNQTIQQHLLHQAQQGQPGTVMLLQYPPPSPQQGHLPNSSAPPTLVSSENTQGNAIVRMPISLRMTVPVQQQPNIPTDNLLNAQTHLAQLSSPSNTPHAIAPQHLPYGHSGKIIQQLQPAQQQVHIQPPQVQMSHPHLQMQPQSQQLQVPHPQHSQQHMHIQHLQQPHPLTRPQQQMQHVKQNQELNQQASQSPQPQQHGQKRRYSNINGGPPNNNGQQNQSLHQQSPQPGSSPSHQHSSSNHMKQRHGVGNVHHQRKSPQPSLQPSQEQLQPQHLQDGSASGAPPSNAGVEKDLITTPAPSGPTGEWQNATQHQQLSEKHQQHLSNQSPGGDDIKPPEIKRSRLGVNDHHLSQHQARIERPTFNHYSSKPQMYNSHLPFHVHQIGVYPPPPPPPPPTNNNNDSSVGQFATYYQQHGHPQNLQPQFNPPAANHPAPSGYNPYWMPPQ